MLGDDRDGTRRCEELVPGDVLDEAALARARAGDEDAFRELTDPYRRELQSTASGSSAPVQDAAGSLAQLRADASFPMGAVAQGPLGVSMGCATLL